MKKIVAVLSLILLMNNFTCAQLNRFKQDAWYSIIAIHSGKALEIKGNENGSPLQQNDSTGADNQLFQFKKISAGYFQIVIKSSGKVVEVKDNSLKDHAPIQQNEANNGDHQLFTFIQNGSGYSSIIAKNSGYGFDVLGGVNSLANNAVIIQYPSSGAANQFFRITEIPGK